MFGDYLSAGAFPDVFARPQISASHGSSSAGLVVLEGTEGISAHLLLVGYSHGVPIRD